MTSEELKNLADQEFQLGNYLIAKSLYCLTGAILQGEESQQEFMNLLHSFAKKQRNNINLYKKINSN